MAGEKRRKGREGVSYNPLQGHNHNGMKIRGRHMSTHTHYRHYRHIHTTHTYTHYTLQTHTHYRHTHLVVKIISSKVLRNKTGVSEMT